MGYSFRLASRVFYYIHHSTNRIAHTVASVTPIVEHWQEREIAQWSHHEGSIRRLIAPWADTIPQSYIFLQPRSEHGSIPRCTHLSRPLYWLSCISLLPPRYKQGVVLLDELLTHYPTSLLTELYLTPPSTLQTGCRVTGRVTDTLPDLSTDWAVSHSSLHVTNRVSCYGRVTDTLPDLSTDWAVSHSSLHVTNRVSCYWTCYWHTTRPLYWLSCISLLPPRYKQGVVLWTCYRHTTRTLYSLSCISLLPPRYKQGVVLLDVLRTHYPTSLLTELYFTPPSTLQTGCRVMDVLQTHYPTSLLTELYLTPPCTLQTGCRVTDTLPDLSTHWAVSHSSLHDTNRVSCYRTCYWHTTRPLYWLSYISLLPPRYKQGVLLLTHYPTSLLTELYLTPPSTLQTGCLVTGRVTDALPDLSTDWAVSPSLLHVTNRVSCYWTCYWHTTRPLYWLSCISLPPRYKQGVVLLDVLLTHYPTSLLTELYLPPCSTLQTGCLVTGRVTDTLPDLSTDWAVSHSSLHVTNRVSCYWTCYWHITRPLYWLSCISLLPPRYKQGVVLRDVLLTHYPTSLLTEMYLTPPSTLQTGCRVTGRVTDTLPDLSTDWAVSHSLLHVTNRVSCYWTCYWHTTRPLYWLSCISLLPPRYKQGVVLLDVLQTHYPTSLLTELYLTPPPRYKQGVLLLTHYPTSLLTELYLTPSTLQTGCRVTGRVTDTLPDLSTDWAVSHSSLHVTNRVSCYWTCYWHTTRPLYWLSCISLLSPRYKQGVVLLDVLQMHYPTSLLTELYLTPLSTLQTGCLVTDTLPDLSTDWAVSHSSLHFTNSVSCYWTCYWHTTRPLYWLSCISLLSPRYKQGVVLLDVLLTHYPTSLLTELYLTPLSTLQTGCRVTGRVTDTQPDLSTDWAVSLPSLHVTNRVSCYWTFDWHTTRPLYWLSCISFLPPRYKQGVVLLDVLLTHYPTSLLTELYLTPPSKLQTGCRVTGRVTDTLPDLSTDWAVSHSSSTLQTGCRVTGRVTDTLSDLSTDWAVSHSSLHVTNRVLCYWTCYWHTTRPLYWLSCISLLPPRYKQGVVLLDVLLTHYPTSLLTELYLTPPCTLQTGCRVTDTLHDLSTDWAVSHSSLHVTNRVLCYWTCYWHTTRPLYWLSCISLLPACYKQGVLLLTRRARCIYVVKAFAHGAMGRRIDPSWGGPIELFLVAASAPWLV